MPRFVACGSLPLPGVSEVPRCQLIDSAACLTHDDHVYMNLWGFAFRGHADSGVKVQQV